MLEKLYKKIFLLFVVYVLILNIICFVTTLNPKQLINPFYIKVRTISVYKLLNHIVFEAGLGIKNTPQDQIETYIHKMSQKFKVDPKIIHLIIQTESKFNEYAISRTGAMGLMQVMPGTFSDMSLENPFYYKSNIEAGVKYFSLQLKRFKKLDFALAAYNAGPQNVIKSDGVPNFSETKAYVKSIMSKYQIMLNKEPVSPYQIPPQKD